MKIVVAIAILVLLCASRKQTRLQIIGKMQNRRPRSTGFDAIFSYLRIHIDMYSTSMSSNTTNTYAIAWRVLYKTHRLNYIGS